MKRIQEFSAVVMLVISMLACAPPLQAQRPIKVFLSVDMEGIGGVVTAEQLSPAGFEYQRFREFMTAEALAAIAGAREAGATQFVVADSHGNEQNLLIERFPPDVTIIRGSPRPLGMMEGVDSATAAVFFIGYHAATTNAHGVRAHTISSATFAAVRINGRASAESGLNAAIAGHFGVPVALITGDADAVAELKEIVPSAEGVVVKRSISFHAAATMPPEASQALIKKGARAAIERLREMKAYTVREPVQFDVTYKNYTPAEMMSYMPGIERVDSHTVRFNGSILEAARFIDFAAGYRPDLTP